MTGQCLDDKTMRPGAVFWDFKGALEEASGALLKYLSSLNIKTN
jgi:hypothetical protein